VKLERPPHSGGLAWKVAIAPVVITLKEHELRPTAAATAGTHALLRLLSVQVRWRIMRGPATVRFQLG
jgi:hypothetical protein